MMAAHSCTISVARVRLGQSTCHLACSVGLLLCLRPAISAATPPAPQHQLPAPHPCTHLKHAPGSTLAAPLPMMACPPSAQRTTTLYLRSTGAGEGGLRVRACPGEWPCRRRRRRRASQRRCQSIESPFDIKCLHGVGRRIGRAFASAPGAALPETRRAGRGVGVPLAGRCCGLACAEGSPCWQLEVLGAAAHGGPVVAPGPSCPAAWHAALLLTRRSSLSPATGLKNLRRWTTPVGCLGHPDPCVPPHVP